MKKILFALFALVALFALGSCGHNGEKHHHGPHSHHHNKKIMHFHHLKNEYKVGDELKVEAHSFKKEIKEYRWFLKLKTEKLKSLHKTPKILL